MHQNEGQKELNPTIFEEDEFNLYYFYNCQEPLKLTNGKWLNVITSIDKGFTLLLQELPAFKTSHRTSSGHEKPLGHRVDHQHQSKLTAYARVSDGKLWKKLPADDVIYYFKVTNTRFDEKTIDYYDEECQDEEYDETKENYCQIELVRLRIDPD